MKKIFYIILLLTLSHSLSAQEKVETIEISCDSSCVYINKLLKGEMPFFIKTDTVDKDINLVNDELYYITENTEYKIDSYGESTSCLSEFTKLKYYNTNIYIILMCEFLVGYDYFIIVKENPLEFFISETYDFGLNEGYHIMFETLNFENKTLKILLNNSKEEQSIKFKELIIK